MTTPTQRTPILVVPHFSRLQEWIVLDEGFFQALQFAEKWPLHTYVQDTQYSHLIVPGGM